MSAFDPEAAVRNVSYAPWLCATPRVRPGARDSAGVGVRAVNYSVSVLHTRRAESPFRGKPKLVIDRTLDFFRS
jgi:hypothetical protein